MRKVKMFRELEIEILRNRVNPYGKDKVVSTGLPNMLTELVSIPYGKGKSELSP